MGFHPVSFSHFKGRIQITSCFFVYLQPAVSLSTVVFQMENQYMFKGSTFVELDYN